MEPVQENERKSLKQQVIDAIKQYISSKELRAGDKLATERNFADMFDVSRSVVREALSYLENTGVIRVRQGQGIFLNDSNVKELLDSFFFLWEINNGNIKDILGLRLIFESSAIDEIVSHNNNDAILSLRQIVENNHPETVDAFRTADIAFHTELLQATNNQLFSQLTNVITAYFFQIQHVVLTSDEYERATKEHLQIVQALEKWDAAGAKSILANHINRAKL